MSKYQTHLRKAAIDNEQSCLVQKNRHLLYRSALFMICIVLLLAVGGCSLGSKTGGKWKGPRGTKPYTIKGKTYYPLFSAHGFVEDGIASWYGRDFHGKKTANGERYNMHGMTAAHKLLPFNTKVRVTNKQNGRSIIVRINDRGPFVSKRIIDLTKTGAQKLGMLQSGTANVRIEAIETMPQVHDGDMDGRFFVQVGAFSNKRKAEQLANKVRRQRSDVRSYHDTQLSLWRVEIGPFASLNQASDVASSLQGEFPTSFVTADEKNKTP